MPPRDGRIHGAGRASDGFAYRWMIHEDELDPAHWIVQLQALTGPAMELEGWMEGAKLRVPERADVLAAQIEAMVEARVLWPESGASG